MWRVLQKEKRPPIAVWFNRTCLKITAGEILQHILSVSKAF